MSFAELTYRLKRVTFDAYLWGAINYRVYLGISYDDKYLNEK